MILSAEGGTMKKSFILVSAALVLVLVLALVSCLKLPEAPEITPPVDETLGVPQLQTPQTGAMVEAKNISFQWNPVNDVTGYELQYVLASQALTDNSPAPISVNAIPYTLVGIINEGDYKWRVRGVNVTKNLVGNWAEPNSFRAFLRLPEANFTSTSNNKRATINSNFQFDVTFTDNSQSGTRTITNWEWEFEVGQISNDDVKIITATTTQRTDRGPHTITYRAGGCYYVRLKVFDGVKRHEKFVQNFVKISFMQRPTACFAFVKDGLKVQFTDHSDKGAADEIKWEWNFGDTGSGNTSNDQNPEHIFSIAGNYDVTLKASNSSNNSSLFSSFTRTITVP